MKNLTQGNIYKRFILFGLPLMLGGLISQIYSTVDTAMVGKLLGDKELASLSATSPLIKVVTAIFWGFSGGVGPYIAKLYGKQDIKGIKDTIKFVLTMNVIVSVAISVVLLVFKTQIFTFLKVDTEIWDLASDYYVVYVSGYFTFTLTSVLYHTSTATNKSVMPFIANLISCVLNIGGNYLSIAVFNLGVKGVALSSVISSLAVTIYYLIFIKIHLSKQYSQYEDSRLNVKEILGYGIPCIFQQWLIYVPGFVISPFINNLGYEATASLSVINIIFTICEGLYVNSSRAVSIHSAQCLGQKNYLRIKKGVVAGLVQESVFILPVIAICMIFPNFICNVFLDNEASQIIRDNIFRFVYVCLPFILLNASCSTLHSFYRGVKSMNILLLVTGVAGVVRTIVTLVLVANMQMDAIYLGWTLSWAIEALVSWVLYFSNIWQPKEMKLALKNAYQSDLVQENN